MATKKPATDDKKPQEVEITLAYETEIAGELEPAGKKVTVWEDQAERIQKMHEQRKKAEAAQEAK